MQIKIHNFACVFQNVFMKRMNDLMFRRDNAIYAKFNELLTTGMPTMLIYEQLSEEFWLAESTIRYVVSKKNHENRLAR